MDLELQLKAAYEMVCTMYPDITDKGKDQLKHSLRYYVEKYFSLLKENEGYVVANSFLRLLDSEINEYMKADDVARGIVCKRGCSHCCKIAVTITSEEAALLATVAKKKGIKLSKKTLEVQSRFNPYNWHEMKEKYASCVFLKDGECQVYEHRPISCRAHFSLSSPDLCDSFKGDFKTKLWKPIPIEIIVSASIIAGKSDFMPRKLLQAWDKYYK